MGCFLGCFGISSKRKRRRQADRVLSGGQVRRLCLYEALKSDPAKLDIPVEELRKTTKETLNSKIRKKVRFNLNVQTYEPIPGEESGDNLWEDDKDADYEKAWGANLDECRLFSDSNGEDTTTAEITLYPPNYRYRNCFHSCEEEDEIAYYESDLDEDYDEDENENDMRSYFDDIRESEEEFSEQGNSLPVNLHTGDSLGQDRSLSAHSVLKPVENITQWKAAKARGITTPTIKHQIKENVNGEEESGKPFGSMPASELTEPAIHDVTVTASLSNWLVFSDHNEPFGTRVANGYRFDRTSPLMNSDDNPMLDLW